MPSYQAKAAITACHLTCFVQLKESQASRLFCPANVCKAPRPLKSRTPIHYNIFRMLPTDQDVTDFLEDVSSVSRLIDGLKAGTISPEYVDTKIAERAQSTKAYTIKQAAAAQDQRQQQQQATDAAVAADTAKQAELLRKVEELKASRERKLKARQQYEGYVQGKKQQQQHGYATDYTRWELWCPSDEEDDLFNSLTPNSPAFRAMEQDISKRHARCVLRLFFLSSCACSCAGTGMLAVLARECLEQLTLSPLPSTACRHKACSAPALTGVLQDGRAAAARRAAAAAGQ